MALQKQNLAISFNKGVNEKIDTQQLNFEGLKRLENAVFTDVGALNKRNGYDKLPTMDMSDINITNMRSLTSFKDELCLFTTDQMYTYSPSAGEWIAKGNLKRASLNTTPILRNLNSQSEVQAACTAGVELYIWADSRGGYRYSTLDCDNEAFFASDVSFLSGSETNVKIVALQNVFHVFYIDGTNLKMQKMRISDPTTFEAAVTVDGGVDASNKIYSVNQISDKIYFAFTSTDSGGQINVGNIDIDETVSSVIGIAGEIPTKSIDIIGDANERVIIAWANNTAVKIIGYNTGLSSVLLTKSTVETISNVTQVAVMDDSAGVYRVYYSQSAANTYDYLIRENTVTLAASVGTASDFARSVSQASLAFKYDDKIYFLVNHDSTLQRQYFLMDQDGEVVTRLGIAGEGGGIINNNMIPRIYQDDDGQWLLPTQIVGKTISEENELFGILGAARTELVLDDERRLTTAVMGDNLYVAGGIMQVYDGDSLVEDNFHLFPENISLNGTSISGGDMTDGDYLYQAVYSWVDKNGQIHRSAPSPGFTVTLSGGTSTQQVDLDIPTLRLTNKQDVFIEVFRSQVNGTVLRKTRLFENTVFNDPTVDLLTFTTGQADSVILGHELLYTTGGVLENAPARIGNIITTHKNRIILAGLKDKRQIAYSKNKTPGVNVEFSDFLELRVDDGNDDVTALASMDGKLIIFKRNTIYAVVGDGPTDTGDSNTFSLPELIATDVGCNNQDSVVLTPNGLMFQSSKGIYLLDRSLNLVYIGSNVEDLTGELTISSAELVPDSNQIRFTTKDGECIVYDYLVQQWSTFTNHKAWDATVHNNKYYYLRLSDEGVYEENKSKYLDDATDYSMAIESGWLSFAGLQGRKRVYDMALLGRYYSPHKLRLKTAYDFNDVYTHSAVIDSSELVTEDAYGNLTYGTETPYGGDDGAYQVKFKFEKQKIQSVKFLLEEINEDSSGRSAAWSGATFTVGVKSGTHKMDNGKETASSLV